jgi:Tfp pilus assembly ATPase PilU
MVEKQASDLFFSTDAPVQIKIEGVLRPIGDKPLARISHRSPASLADCAGYRHDRSFAAAID